MKPIAAVLWLLFFSQPAQADRCAAPSGASRELEQVDSEVRLRVIQERLRHAAHRTRIWAWTWGSVYGSLVGVNAILLAFAEPKDRVDQYAGGFSAAVGVLSLAVAPRKVMHDQRWLDRRVASAPASTDRCALLADAERLLARDAKDAAFGKGPLMHFGNIAYNLGLGLFLGLGFGHWVPAAISISVGITVGGLQIATQPIDIIDGFRRYQVGDLGPTKNVSPFRWTLFPKVDPQYYGLQLVFSS